MQEDHNFEVRVGYTARSCLKQKKDHPQEQRTHKEVTVNVIENLVFSKEGKQRRVRLGNGNTALLDSGVLALVNVH
jgi:hypothetical protein